MLRVFIGASVGLALLYAGLCVVLFVFQRSVIYAPQTGSNGEGTTTTVLLQIATARVLVSTRPSGGPDALIYFGGNAEDVSVNVPSFSDTFPRHAIYLLHYRGYGGSTGSPSEEALFTDGLALFDHVYAQHQNIVVVGRSLGSGIAVRVASLRPAARLVLVTPFDSLQEIAVLRFPYLPVRWLLRDKFESWRYAPHVMAPTLIIAAEHDKLIPRASTELLQTRFRNGRVKLVVVAGVGHNTISNSQDYWPLLRSGG